PDGRVKTAFGERVDLISSVAFWYQKGIALDQPAVPYGSARPPHGNARQIEVESRVGESRAEKGRVSVSKELFWGKDVILFEGEGPGSRLEVPFSVEEEGDYEVITQVAQAPTYGIYDVLLHGKAAERREREHEPGADSRDETRFAGYACHTYVGLERRTGWPRLARR